MRIYEEHKIIKAINKCKPTVVNDDVDKGIIIGLGRLKLELNLED